MLPTVLLRSVGGTAVVPLSALRTVGAPRGPSLPIRGGFFMSTKT